VFYFLCVLSKETGLAMLGLVPFTLYFFTKIDIKTILSRSALFLLMAAVYFLIRMLAMDSMTFEEDMHIINNSLAGATSVSERIASTISILGRYVQLLVFPHPLSYDYSYNQMAERFVFNSALGFCIVLAWLLHHYLKPGETLASAKTFLAVIGIITLFYSIKTVSRNTVWKNGDTLFLSGLTTAPNSARAHNHYGSHLLKTAEVSQDVNLRNKLFTQAIPHFNDALKILPDFSEAGYNKGVCYYNIGKSEKARTTYLQTLSHNPNNIDVLNNLGVIYFNENNYEKALEYWLRILAFRKDHVNALGNVGAVYQRQGDPGKALFYYEQAIKIGANRNVLNNAIKAYRSLGQEEKAARIERGLK